MGYALEFDPRGQREFDRLPIAVQARITKKIDALCDDPRPRGVVKLAGSTDRYRLRVGPYRVLYVVVDERRIVIVGAVGTRQTVYDR